MTLRGPKWSKGGGPTPSREHPERGPAQNDATLDPAGQLFTELAGKLSETGSQNRPQTQPSLFIAPVKSCVFLTWAPNSETPRFHNFLCLFWRHFAHQAAARTRCEFALEPGLAEGAIFGAPAMGPSALKWSWPALDSISGCLWRTFLCFFRALGLLLDCTHSQAKALLCQGWGGPVSHFFVGFSR